MTIEQTIDNITVRRKAMDLLARREHSRIELTQKLRQRELPLALINTELDKLEREHLLSDVRFTESYIAMRRNNGFGPVRIRQELRQRGISADLINTALNESDTIWTQRAAEVRSKRFGEQPANDFTIRAKQAGFLNYRGFTPEQIESVLGSE